MKSKLTPSMKNKITKGWNTHFPGMGIYRPMWLMNICGPLAVGILLQDKYDKTVYTPLLHIHNLCLDFSAVSLGVSIETENIPVSDDEEVYTGCISKLKKGTYIPLEGTIDLNGLLMSMKAYFSKAWYKSELLSYMIYLAAWSGAGSVFDDIYSYVTEKIEDCNEIMQVRNRKEKWLSSIPHDLSCTDTLRKKVKEQEDKLKLADLPHREMIF